MQIDNVIVPSLLLLLLLLLFSLSLSLPERSQSSTCAFEECQQEARPGSRYCSDTCGTANARLFLLRKPELAEKEWAAVETSLEALLQSPGVDRAAADQLDLKTLTHYEVLERESASRMKSLEAELEAVFAYEATLVGKECVWCVFVSLSFLVLCVCWCECGKWDEGGMCVVMV
jgi:hypothetical protein